MLFGHSIDDLPRKMYVARTAIIPQRTPTRIKLETNIRLAIGVILR